MNDDDLITSLGTEDTITLSSPDLYNWDYGSPNLTAATISTLDLTTSSTMAPSLTLSPNAYPYSNVVPNGGYAIPNVGAISGALGSSSSPWVNIGTNMSNLSPSGRIEISGEDADILINGKSLSKTIRALEERLNMLRPNEHLEAEWDQLRELGEAYRRLEADLLEKQRAWEILKKQ